jgi:hypothetical protein
VNGVHYDGHAGGARGYSAVHARFRIVRMHDVRTQLPEDAPELPERESVIDRRQRARRAMERNVPDAQPFDLADERSGRRDPDDVVAGFPKGGQLRAQQQGQADVGRRDVREDRAAHDVAPA